MPVGGSVGSSARPGIAIDGEGDLVGGNPSIAGISLDGESEDVTEGDTENTSDGEVDGASDTSTLDGITDATSLGELDGTAEGGSKLGVWEGLIPPSSISLVDGAEVTFVQHL